MARGKRVPLKAKEDIKRKYLSGVDVDTIVRETNREWGINVSRGTVYKWSADEKGTKEEGLQLAKEMVKVSAWKPPVEKTDVERQRDLYKKLANKTSKFIGLEDDEEPLIFDKTIDAVKALDIGIQGERKIQSGVVSLELVARLYQVLAEEIIDDVVLNRIATKFKIIAADIASEAVK